MAQRDVTDAQVEGSSEGTSELRRWDINGFGVKGKFKKGRFTKEESNTVKAAIEEYCAAHDISPSRLCSRMDLHRTGGAWKQIAQSLPDRMYESVYRHGMRLLHPFKRGPWTEEEVKQLFALIDQHGNQFAKIGRMLNRNPESCFDKFRETNGDFVEGPWTEKEVELLKQYVREHFEVHPETDIRELVKLGEARGIPWSTISRRFGRRSRVKCWSKWCKLTRGLCASDKYKMRRRRKSTAAVTVVTPNPAMADRLLLSHLVMSGATRASNVDWRGMPEEVTTVLGDAQSRWKELVHEWNRNESPDEEWMQWPLSKLAQTVLSYTTRKLAAKAEDETPAETAQSAQSETETVEELSSGVV